jgi:hypothetical protein
MIGIQSLQNNYWLKLDAKVPIAWGVGVGARFNY